MSKKSLLALFHLLLFMQNDQNMFQIWIKPEIKLLGQKQIIFKTSNSKLISILCWTVSLNTNFFCSSPASHWLSLNPSLSSLWQWRDGMCSMFLLESKASVIKLYDVLFNKLERLIIFFYPSLIFGMRVGNIPSFVATEKCYIYRDIA